MREHEPLYLHDIVLPKEVEKPRRGFDLDREFGEGTKERIVNGLKLAISDAPYVDLDSLFRERFDDTEEQGLDITLAYYAAYLRILTGERFGDTEEEDRMINALKEDMRSSLERKTSVGDFVAALRAATLRILTGERLGTKEEEKRIIEALQEEVKFDLEQGVDLVAARNAALLRILTGERFGDTEEQNRMINALKENMRYSLKSKTPKTTLKQELDDYVRDARRAAALRILRAHEIKFIPGKGIEIIDDAPEEYKKQDKIPLPEVRKF